MNRFSRSKKESENNPLGRYGVYYKGGGGAPETTTTISKSEPPEYVKPYSIQMMNRAGELSNKPYESYDGQRIADFTDQHTQGLDMTENRALNGSDTMNLAQDNAQGTFNDNYLNQAVGMVDPNPYMGQANAYAGENPYLQNAIDQASRDVTNNYSKVVSPQLAAMDRNSGSFGNSGIAETQSDARDVLSRNLGNISSNMRMQDYGQQAQLAESGLNRDAMLAETMNTNKLNQFNAERTNQMRGMAFAPQLAESDYRDAQALLGVGDVYRDYNQSKLNQGYDQWQSEQNYPYQQLDVLANGIRTSMGGGGTMVSSAPNAYTSSPVAGAIGGGIAGYGAGQELGFNPWLGAAGGGLLGGLF